MSVDNRLTDDQLATLSPGDSVVIESGRPRHSTGTVVRAEGPHIAVSVRSPRGAAYVEQYRRRDGSRIGGRIPAKLINADAPVPQEAQRRTRHIDSLFRDWARHRTDVNRLRALHDAIGECLEVLIEPTLR
ncbi:hypothetical protein SAMN05660657_05535 [Geodermatophilus amargosae]|uniref:Uncharacterized protein n=1 Tax=Geodermatophilus amargosae TaxID=1296565 RepID=A0A1I7DAA5_9ACTN|nr:hypothetical protein [Geodermatophilus amargosae]SFU08554.1 hypothetical protein SAMN05660657_05535 [Geodermatophilus amargosae]